MNLDLASLFPDLEALTPDGRWNMLQDWLAKNPEYGERAERWSTQTVDQVYNEIGHLAFDKYGTMAALVINSPTVKAKIKRWIELLQACYRERQAYDNQPIEKEKKNVSTRMDNRSNKQRAVGKRSKARAKQARDRD